MTVFSALFAALAVLVGPVTVDPIRPAPTTYTTPVATAEEYQP